MKHALLPLLAALAAAVSVPAADVPPAERLLPADTLGMVCVPDCAKAAALRKESPMTLLWNDPAMRPFREKLMKKLASEVIEPLERQLGVKFTNYAELAQGQLTIAVTRNQWTGTTNPLPSLLLIIDSRDRSDQLKENLAGVRKKLAEQERTLKVERIRDMEFTTVVLGQEDLKAGMLKSIPESDKPSAQDKREAEGKSATGGQGGKKVELTFGQAGSVLLVGTEIKEIEKVLAKLSGGTSPCLADEPAFEGNRAVFRDAHSYCWINATPLGEIIVRIAAEASANASNPMAPRPDRIVSAVGLESLSTIAAGVQQSAEGGYVEVFLGLPEAKRKGVFGMLAAGVKEAAPPSFVPADAVQFSRWRLDGQKFWAGLEAIVNEISPGMLGFFLMQLETALKEKDPDFDIRKNIIGNLGDDLMSFQKTPRSHSLEDLNSPPSLLLLGSLDADRLMAAIKTIAAANQGSSGAEPKEREFLGRRILSVQLPIPQGTSQSSENQVHITASGGYVAFSSEAGMIESFLRAGDSKPKPLSETPGLSEAAARVGGTASGLFGYQNDAENTRALYETLRKNPDSFLRALRVRQLPGGPQAPDREQAIKEWLDFSLLPDFDRVSRYFSMTVYSGRFASDGFDLKVFTPTPRQLQR